MKCVSCGAENFNDSKFCKYCGAAMNNGPSNSTTNSSNPSNPPITPNVPNSSYPPPSGYYMGNMPMSVGGWIGRSLIPFIPFVGWLVYLIMLFVWSGDMTKELSFRNWAKAQLVVLAISIVFILIVFLTFIMPLITQSPVRRYY